MPDGDDVLRLFKNAMSYRNNRRVLIDAAKSEYAKELEVLQDKGEDIVDKLKVTAKKIVKGKDEQKPKKPETEQTAPVLAAERYEKSFMNMNIDAAGSVMRPNAPVIHKKSSFFKNIKYDISVSNIVSSNDIGNNMVFVRDLDFFDKTLTLNLQKTGSTGKTQFSAGAGYNAFKNRLKVDVRYDMPQQYVRGRVYLEKNNPGINAEYVKELPKDGKLNINGGVFKEDAAFQVEYNTKLDKDSRLIIGAYGTTKYKETGVYGRLEF